MECEWQRRTLGTRSISAQREQAALPKRQTFGVILDSIISVVRRAIFRISCFVGGPLGGILVVDSGGGDRNRECHPWQFHNATTIVRLSFHDCCHLIKQWASWPSLRSFGRLFTLLYTRGGTLGCQDQLIQDFRIVACVQSIVVVGGGRTHAVMAVTSPRRGHK